MIELQQKNSEDNVFYTDRLIFKPISQNDFDALFSMFSNSAVMQYIYDGKTFSEAKTRELLKKFINHWQKHGIGFWMIYLKENNQPIGYIGFRQFIGEVTKLNDKMEFGYTLDEPYWGKGYTKESASACLQYSVAEQKLNSVFAMVLPENLASISVLKYAGFSYAEKIKCEGLWHNLYVHDSLSQV